MDRITWMANLIGYVVVVFVAVAFITLAIFYFKAQERLLRAGLEDEALRKEIRLELRKKGKGFTSAAEAEQFFRQREKRQSALGGAVWGLCMLLFTAMAAFVLFSHAVSGERHIWLGEQAMLTIQSGSMATANRNNTYLFDASGTADENARIPQYTFITISRAPEHIAALRPGDIAAFTMTAEDGVTQLTVIHRLLEVTTGEDGTCRYTFRGDANPLSMDGEIGLRADRIVGVFQTENYHGVKAVLLGHFISYLRTSTGMAMTGVALLVMLVYLTLSDRMDRAYALRLTALRREELERFFSGDVQEDEAAEPEVELWG